ncbi:MAG TPA: ABC transporter permease [bacterium]|nr:ABC transporter permease [bacterium]
MAVAARPPVMFASPRIRALRQFARHRAAVAGFVVLAGAIVVSVAAPWLAPYDPIALDVAHTMAPPSAAHPLGTDELGRDILSRLLWGGRDTLLITAAAVAIAFVSGAALGVVAGYRGGRSDTVIMRVMDVLLAMPGFLLAVAIIAALGVGIVNVIIAIGINSIPPFARIARGSTLLVREETYVHAARALGAGERTIMARHVLPNILSPLVVEATLRLATAILTASGLSFLGLGVQPPTAEWGAMLSVGRDYITSSPQLVIIPGAAILAVTLAFNMVGDGLRDALDPRQPARANVR